MNYVKKPHLKRMYNKEEDKRVEDNLLNTLILMAEDYLKYLIKHSVLISEITAKKTLQPNHVIIACKNKGLTVQNEVIYAELNKGSIKRLVREQYDGRISDKFVDCLINQCEGYLREIIKGTIQISDLKGRKTVKLSDLEYYNEYKEKLVN